MKRCPFCKAEIEDNARFCLYCMTSLEEKQVVDTPKDTHKRWPVILAAVFVLFLIAGGIWMGFSRDNGVPTSSGTSENKTSTVSHSSSSGQNQVAGEPAASMTADNSHTTPASHGLSATGTKSGGRSSSTNMKATVTTTASGKTTSLHNTPATSKTAAITSNTSAKSTTSKTAAVRTSSAPTTGSTASQAVYAYRKAQKGDDFSLSYPIPKDAIVITGVTTPSSDGTYVIPASIDGHTVIAIMGAAFSGSDIKNSVTKVVVPATVKTIWNYAFAGCYHLRDIYFCGNAIYTEALAFPDASKRTGTLTIHCSADCHDRNLRLYKNSAGYYDAQYQEWDGNDYH